MLSRIDADTIGAGCNAKRDAPPTSAASKKKATSFDMARQVQLAVTTLGRPPANER